MVEVDIRHRRVPIFDMSSSAFSTLSIQIGDSPVNRWMSSVTLCLNSSSGSDSIYSASRPAIQPQRMWAWLKKMKVKALYYNLLVKSEVCCISRQCCRPFRLFLHSERWHLPNPALFDVSHVVRNVLLKTQKCLALSAFHSKSSQQCLWVIVGLWVGHRPHPSTPGRWFHTLGPTTAHQIPQILCCMCQIQGFEWRAPWVVGVAGGTELSDASGGSLPKWLYTG